MLCGDIIFRCIHLKPLVETLFFSAQFLADTSLVKMKQWYSTGIPLDHQWNIIELFYSLIQNVLGPSNFSFTLRNFYFNVKEVFILLERTVIRIVLYSVNKTKRIKEKSISYTLMVKK